MTTNPQDGEMPDIIYLIHHADGEGEHAWSTDPDPTGFIQENEVTKYIKAASIAERLKEKMDRGQFTYLGGEYVFCMKPDDARDLKALADSMIKEAGRDVV